MLRFAVTSLFVQDSTGGVGAAVAPYGGSQFDASHFGVASAA